mgnify:CR=1 FL=1
MTGECCAPFLRVSPATVPPERAPTVAGGHLRHSGTSASDAPPLRRRNVMPLAMRPLREQTAHCRRTPVLPSALTRSPPVAAPTPNKRPSGIGGDLFSSRSRVYRIFTLELIPLNGNDTWRGAPRAAQPSVHRRCNRRLNAAARSATSRARRKIKQTRA